jgi:hypothetical protein
MARIAVELLVRFLKDALQRAEAGLRPPLLCR